MKQGIHSQPKKKIGIPISKQKSSNYHFITTESSGFPWLDPAYIPYVFIGKVVSDRDFDVKEDNDEEYQEEMIE